MDQKLMAWESYPKRIGGSIYITLPKDYVRFKGIDEEHLLEFELNPDGSLTLRKTEKVF